MIFNCGVMLTHYNCICVLFLITLNMATRMADICQLITGTKLYSYMQVQLLVFLKNSIHQVQCLTKRMGKYQKRPFPALQISGINRK